MAIQQRFTVSVLWVDHTGRKMVSKMVDASSSEQAARIAFNTLFPLHDRVWVYNCLSSFEQVTEYQRAERGKVKEV